MPSDLPCGVTQSMCDGYDPECAKCGHLSSDHYDDDNIEYNSDGQVTHACDCTRGKTEEEKQKNWCACDGFVEGCYEPDFEYDDEPYTHSDWVEDR